MTDHAQADRLYVVVRDDLPIGLQAAQAAHATFEFSIRYPLITQRWMDQSNFIVLTVVPDESTLLALHRQAIDAGIRAVLNHEPDVGDTATATVLEPGPTAKRLCRDLPLLGRVMAPV